MSLAAWAPRVLYAALLVLLLTPADARAEPPPLQPWELLGDDIGAIFGIGFPAFRGGPLRMIDDLGAGRVVDVLKELQDQYGERFAPTDSLVDMARRGARYYPA